VLDEEETARVMISCYLDEAGGEEEQFTVVCGWLSTEVQWEQFEIDWRLMLASYGLAYFHMKEFSQSTKIFKKWKGSEGIRRRFIHDATEIIRSRVQFGVLVYTHHEIFRTVNSRFQLAELLRSPYAIAGRGCVALVDKWRLVNAVQEKIEFVFEDGGPDKGGLVKAMDVARKLPAPIFEPGRDIRAKDGNVRNGVVQLQSADFLAYELRKHHREFSNRTGRPVRRSFYEVLKIPLVAMASFNAGNAQELCQLEEGLLSR